MEPDPKSRAAQPARPQELRYRIADAINDGIKRLPGVHALLKRMALRREAGQLLEQSRRSRTDSRRIQELLRLPFGLNVTGFLASEKGVGEAMRATIRSLSAVDLPFVVHPLHDPMSRDREFPATFLSNRNPYRINLLHINAQDVMDFIRTRPTFLQDRLNVADWAWELARFPEHWIPLFEYFDQIWVPSEFVRSSVASRSPIPVCCVPYSLDLDMLQRARTARADFGLPQQEYLFLFMFDFRSIMERKNPLGLVDAFRIAFGDRSDVRLLIKTSHAADFAEEHERLTRHIGSSANIQIMDCVLPRSQTLDLLASADCYLSLHRSEGFGLTLTESMAMGKPVIATAYSGNMDFMTTENSFLVDHRLLGISGEFGPYKDAEWADPDLQQAAAHMRFVVADRTATARIADHGRKDVLAKYSPEAVGRTMQQALLTLEGAAP